MLTIIALVVLAGVGWWAWTHYSKEITADVNKVANTIATSTSTADSSANTETSGNQP
jgi:hypothetical protein